MLNREHLNSEHLNRGNISIAGFTCLLFKWFAIQMPGSMVLGI